MPETNGIEIAEEKYLPFKFDKQAALDAYKEFKHGKIFAPSIFRKKAHIEELEAVYMPMWSFSGEVEGDVHYEGKKVRQYEEIIDGERKDVTETEVHNIELQGTVGFDETLIPATTAVSKRYFDYMEPFDLSEATDTPEVAAAGRKIDTDRAFDTCLAEGQEAIDAVADDQMKLLIKGYSSVEAKPGNGTPKVKSATKVYVPVWYLNTPWKGKDYQFAMSAQTGRVSSELPVAMGKVIASLVLLFVATFVLVAYSDATSWHIVGWPARVIMYLVLPSFVSGALTFSYYNQLMMVNRPKPPTPNSPVILSDGVQVVEELDHTDYDAQKKKERLSLR